MMPRVKVHLPSLLESAAGARTVEAQGDTLQEALHDLFTRYPRLQVHVCNESGEFREHVLCFINDQNTRWLDSLDIKLKPTDSLTFLQAVSGG